MQQHCSPPATLGCDVHRVISEVSRRCVCNTTVAHERGWRCVEKKSRVATGHYHRVGQPAGEEADGFSCGGRVGAGVTSGEVPWGPRRVPSHAGPSGARKGGGRGDGLERKREGGSGPAQRPVIAWDDAEETDTDHYRVLGVSRDADEAAISSAFKRRSGAGRCGSTQTRTNPNHLMRQTLGVNQTATAQDIDAAFRRQKGGSADLDKLQTAHDVLGCASPPGPKTARCLTNRRILFSVLGPAESGCSDGNHNGG
eukprot:COSAG04_NODE_2253_length_4444_cov_1.563507_1_plen_254_part_10